MRISLVGLQPDPVFCADLKRRGADSQPQSNHRDGCRHHSIPWPLRIVFRAAAPGQGPRQPDLSRDKAPNRWLVRCFRIAVGPPALSRLRYAGISIPSPPRTISHAVAPDQVAKYVNRGYSIAQQARSESFSSTMSFVPQEVSTPVQHHSCVSGLDASEEVSTNVRIH